MAYTVTITFDASKVKAPVDHNGSEVCDTFVPGGAAANLPVFDKTYYDTNTDDRGFGDKFETFFAAQISHPGVIAAMKKAVKDGSYSYQTEDGSLETMFDEMKDNLADAGFTFEFVKA